MVIKLSGGAWSVKETIKIFGFTLPLPTETGTLDGKTFTLDEGVSAYKTTIKLYKNSQIVLSIAGQTASISVQLFGVTLYSHSFSVGDLLKGKAYTIHGFNDFGITLSSVTITVTA